MEPLKFEEIFEQDARWLMGPSMLAKIVKHVEGKCLVAELVPDDHCSISIAVPLPTVKDELSGEEVSIAAMVPPELFELFRGCLTAAIHDYLGEDGSKEIANFLGQKSTPATVHALQMSLRRMEEERRAHNEARELVYFVAKHFGLSFNPCVQIIYG